MPSGYTYRSGPQVFDKIAKTSAALAAGDAVKDSSGSIVPLTTGARCIGVSMETKADGTARTQILVVSPGVGRTKFLAWEKRASGSLAATDAHRNCDMSGTTGAMGFDSSTSADTSSDIHIDTVLSTGAINVGSALIIFSDPAFLQVNV